MRKVKYIGTVDTHLTTGNIYDVLGYVETMGYQGAFLIKDNSGRNTHYGIYDYNNIPMFIDVTAECRDEVINGILE